MTRDGVVTEVLRRMGRYTQLDTTLQTNLATLFNNVCDEFPFLHEWQVVQAPLFTFSLVAGYSDYALPSDCVSIWSIRDQTNSVQLIPADIKEIERGTLTTGSSPVRYARWGDYIVLDPYPSATEASLSTMAIRYTVPITQPAAGTDTVVTWTDKTLPSKFFELLVRGTLYYGYKSLEMENEAVVAQQGYVDYTNFLINGENRWKVFAWDAQMQVRTQ